MATYSKQQTNLHREKVRQAMVVMGPYCSVQEIVDFLKSNKLDLSWLYVSKLREKIMGQRVRYLQTKIANVHFADYEDTIMQTVKKAWAIIFSEYENTSNKLKAMREVREAKYQLLQTLMDSGILERHQGSLNIIHTMSAEMQKELAEVKACWKLQFGERIRPIIYQEPEEAKIIEGKKINEPTESKPDTRSPNQKILDAKSGGFIG